MAVTELKKSQVKISEIMKTSAKAAREVKALTALVDKLADRLIRVDQRAITGPVLEQHIWKIWGHCRQHADSLDSERHCRIIHKVIESAVAGVQARCEALAEELREARKENSKLRAQLKECKKKAAAEDVGGEDFPEVL